MSTVAASASLPAADDAWGWAVKLLLDWGSQERRIDWLLDDLPRTMSTGVRGRVQVLVLGTLRQLGRIDAVLDNKIQRPPRPWVYAALRVAGYEIIAAADETVAAKVGHHLVERVRRGASAGEAKFANALGRHLSRELSCAPPSPSDDAPLSDWVRYYSHPEWLIERWFAQWGAPVLRQLLELHQTPAAVTVRWRGGSPPPDWLQAVENAPGFFTVPSGEWSAARGLLEAGEAQVQDAATRHAIDLMNPQPGEMLLDLCASPGGKSLALADAMQQGAVVCVDLPGRRQSKLKENLTRFPAGVSGHAVPADVLRGLARALEAAGQPVEYPGVLLDVPCSNTGVMRHRVDVRWRLPPDAFGRHARQQLDLLLAAADRVAPKGRLVYSTCSIDREENEQLVQAFLRRRRGEFELIESHLSRPWETGHDGAAVFLLRRTEPRGLPGTGGRPAFRFQEATGNSDDVAGHVVNSD